MDTLSQDRPRVLIVDDKKNWRETLSDVLDPTLYEIVTAASFEEAKHKLRRQAFHVLVTDQRLVDDDETNIQGILLLDEVSKLHDGTQTIVVTGYPSIEAAKKALRGYAAYDYLLKHPEEGEEFDIIEYRRQVKEAVEESMGARQSAITRDLSIEALIPDFEYANIAQALVCGDATLPDMINNVRRVLNWLVYPLQPLAHQMGRVWMPKTNRTCEILCWSRNHGKAVLIRIGEESAVLDACSIDWLKPTWHLTKNEQFASTPILGISNTIDEMTFEDFAALVQGK